MRWRRTREIWLIAGPGLMLQAFAPGVAAKPHVQWEIPIDGSGHSHSDPAMNATATPLLRAMQADYADGLSAMSGPDRPGARALSNAICDQEGSLENPHRTSDYLWQWGQFVDHDIDLTDAAEPPEGANIPVPAGDAWFDPSGSGAVEIGFDRSRHAGAPGVRDQMNMITGWIDASNVYGSDSDRATALRTLDGSGRLRTGPGDLLPDDTSNLPNAGKGMHQVMFLAGDVRANEQVALTAMHTLFVREHNRLADELRERFPQAEGEQIYQVARRLVAALMQSITYHEFLPALLGPQGLPPYHGYDEDLDARVSNAFSTAAYRFGHSALSASLLRLGPDLRPVEGGPLALRDAFFQPDRLRLEGGVDPVLRGLAFQRHQAVDVQVIDDVRNFLFGPPGAGGFDLAALNIQRGRDHGLPSYVEARAAHGLPPVESFADLNPDPEVQARFASVYASVEAIDLWAGGLAEEPLRGGHLGPLFAAIVGEQFRVLRDGDRLWFERSLPRKVVKEIRRTRLSDVIRRNTGIGDELPDDVFRVAKPKRGGRGDDHPRGRDKSDKSKKSAKKQSRR